MGNPTESRNPNRMQLKLKVDEFLATKGYRTGPTNRSPSGPAGTPVIFNGPHCCNHFRVSSPDRSVSNRIALPNGVNSDISEDKIDTVYEEFVALFDKMNNSNEEE